MRDDDDTYVNFEPKMVVDLCQYVGLQTPINNRDAWRSTDGRGELEALVLPTIIISPTI